MGSMELNQRRRSLMQNLILSCNIDDLLVFQILMLNEDVDLNEE